MTPEEADQKMRERIAALLDEIDDHMAEHREKYDFTHPDPHVHKSTIFAGWALQKIAGLQLLVADLIEWREEVIQLKDHGP